MSMGATTSGNVPKGKLMTPKKTKKKSGNPLMKSNK